VKAVEVLGLNVEVASGSPIVLLREQDAPHRVLPIFVGGREAVAIALALSGESPPRPLTHDLFAAVIDSVDAHIDRVEVTEVREGTFMAELAVRSPAGRAMIDSRPSDAIALALRLDAPMFASDEVLDEAGAIVSVRTDDAAIDDDAIDDDVDRFRSFLDEVRPADFTDHRPPDGPPDLPRA
jgi:bifunctional DNase/RNase